MSTKKKGAVASAAEPLHKPFEDACWSYFQDLNTIWHETQQRLSNLQFEHQGAIQRACQTQQQKDFQAVQEDYQRALQSALADAAPARRFADAFTRYKKAVQNAIANIDVEELDPAIVAGIGQSLCVVAQFAGQLTPAKTTADDKANTE